ncbi:RNA polymerase sigma factor [Tepidibacter hydrothermalis]|uniref:RNA polymerase sigma factor n=1 Tax=Tepidibacter hydrothermalis TaxID=3036126 RepID=A0ABY8EHR2_9FIRM|nr:RNA polymerase sigma factor [Tepidibacter hydrothermalis]WFD12316.1 RNA polymerase sigma factor [Tepidibacter hydrothermalis]
MTLCERYHSKILKYLYYSIGNIEDAKDITQEVFVIVYNRIDELQNHENIGGFIYQTAKFLAANFKRKTIKKNSKETSINMEIGSKESDLYEKMIMIYDSEIDESKYVDNVLLMLSEDKQRLYKLYYIENKTYKEISKILNVNETSLRMRYMRLRREIKKITHHVAKEKFVTEEY